jgi:hypothetical protein
MVLLNRTEIKEVPSEIIRLYLEKSNIINAEDEELSEEELSELKPKYVKEHWGGKVTIIDWGV